LGHVTSHPGHFGKSEIPAERFHPKHGFVTDADKSTAAVDVQCNSQGGGCVQRVLRSARLLERVCKDPRQDGYTILVSIATFRVLLGASLSSGLLPERIECSVRWRAAV